MSLQTFSDFCVHTMKMWDEKSSLQYALPVLAALAYLFCKIDGFLMPFLFWHFQMGFHELGHAVAGWMGGQIAVPTYGFTILFGESQIFSVLAPLAFLAGVYFLYELELFFLATVCALFLAANLTTQFLFPHEGRMMIFSLGGFLGEIVLSTILICGFYYQFPERWRWDFFRYLFVLAAFVVLFKSHYLWSRAQQSPGNLPMSGSILSETDISDTEKLLNSGYWNGRTLPNFLMRLHNISWFLILGHYILGLISTTSTPPKPMRRTQ